MEEIALTDTLETNVLSCAKLLTEHNSLDTIVMDFRAMQFWTDFFIVCTATSNTHLRGLSRYAEDFMSKLFLPPLKSIKLTDEDNWSLIDCGPIVIHIMTEEARNFYELEKLWFQSVITKVGE